MGPVRAGVGGPGCVALGRGTAAAIARGSAQGLTASVPARGISGGSSGPGPKAEIKTPDPTPAEIGGVNITSWRKVQAIIRQTLTRSNGQIKIKCAIGVARLFAIMIREQI